jgi:hypothetical protein
MRNSSFIAIATGALIIAGIAGWVYLGHRSLEARASTSMEAQIDPFGVMSTVKDLPTEEFQDFSLVFSSPALKPSNP